jgi:hypothetical protein
MEYFNYRSVAEQAKMPPAELAALARLIRSEFPTDDMLYELHLLRVCMAIRDGYVSLADAAKPDSNRLKKKLL